VDELGGPTARAPGEITAVDEQHTIASGCRVQCDPGAGDPAPDHKDVTSLTQRLLQDLRAGGGLDRHGALFDGGRGISGVIPGEEKGDPAGYQVAHFGEAGGAAGRRSFPYPQIAWVKPGRRLIRRKEVASGRGEYDTELFPSMEVSVKKTITVTVNGVTHRHEVEPRLLLVYYLREVLGLTGTHIGCDTTSCGACTVIMNGLAVKSCTVLAVQADGASILTVEGLARDGALHPIQEGFWEEHGLQCGFCTPGMMLTALQILERNPEASEEEIRHGLDGNLCRCTGYQHIVNSIRYAARKLKDAGVAAIPRPVGSARR